MRLVAGTAFAAILASQASAEPVVALERGEALLSVEAEGRQVSRPDTMTMSAGTITTGATAAEAVAANAVLAQRLITAVKGAGIAARDVRTSNLSVRPSFQDNRDYPGPDGRPAADCRLRRQQPA